MALWNSIIIMSYRLYTPEDDKVTISFWVIAGGLVAAAALKSIIPICFSFVLCYIFLRTDSNINEGKPFWAPGKFTRHLDSSYIRLTKSRYNGSGYHRKRRSKNRY